MTATYDRIVGDFGQTITISMEDADFTSATGQILLLPPSGTLLTKTATVDAGAETLSYVIEESVLDRVGRWQAQGVLTRTGVKVTYSAPTHFLVGPRLE